MMRWGRFLALLLKELRQISRNRSLIISLIIPPTVQLAVFGFALNPTVTDLRMGVIDQSRSQESRELISVLTANHVFLVTGQYLDPRDLDAGLDRGQLDAGLVIPPDFARRRSQSTGTAPVQLLINAVNANTAAIAQGYASEIISDLNRRRPPGNPQPAPTSPDLTDIGRAAVAQPPPGGGLQRAQVVATVTLLYNPGLDTAWFTVTGTFGILLILNGSLVAAATTIREKDTGTLEQLLMTPAETSEIILAKMTPLFGLLCLDVVLVVVTHLLFDLPVRGSLLLLFFAGALCVVVGIGIGTLIGTVARTSLQAQLLSFFVNPPIALLSGATTPVEAMPTWLQPFTLLNPVRHFSLIARGIMIKGSGFDVLYPNFLALAGFASVLLFVSVRRFRASLG